MPTVYVLTYCHRHGETTSVYSTEANAYKAAAQTVAEYLHEIHDEQYRQDIAEAIKSQDYPKTLQLWGEYQCEFGEETIDITPCKLDEGLEENTKKRRPPKRGRRSC